MIELKLLSVISSILIFGICATFSTTSACSDTNVPECWNGVKNFARICYFTDWAVYREGKGKFTPENINADLCTHIIYAFALLDDSLDKIKPADPNADFDKGFYKAITGLIEKGVKPVLGLGGWNDSLEKYSKMLNDPQHRANIVAQISSFLIEHKFLGFDVDIEYPHAYQEGTIEEARYIGASLNEWGVEHHDKVFYNGNSFNEKFQNGVVGTGVPEDKENFVKFLGELRQKFDSDFEKGSFAEKPTLSVAVSGNLTIIEAAYDVPKVAEVCDWIGVMAYDIHTQTDGRTGLTAPFTVQPGDKGQYLQANVQAMMNIWLSRGAPANKLVVGIPFYGRTFRLTDKSLTDINAPSSGEADEGEFTKSKSTLAFYENIDSTRDKGWTVKHENNLGSYAFKDSQWVGYDDTYDVAVKAEYTKLNCFFGIMIWALDYDCFQQDCAGGSYPLLTTLRNVLTGSKIYTDVKNIT